jgi:hypothetical protein
MTEGKRPIGGSEATVVPFPPQPQPSAYFVFRDLSAPGFPKPRVRELPVNGYCMNLIRTAQK